MLNPNTVVHTYTIPYFPSFFSLLPYYSVSLHDKKKPWNPAGMHFCLYNNEIKQFKKTRMLGCVLWIHFMFMRAEKLWDWVCVINVSIMLLTNVNTIKHSSATSSPWLKATTIKVWKNKYTQPFIIYSWHFITHKIYNYYIIFQQHISCSVFLNVIQYTD